MTEKTAAQIAEEKARERIAKAKADLKAAKRRQSQERRRMEDTAKFTVGGAFQALLENEDTRDQALEFWDHQLKSIAPHLFTDRRRQALEQVMGLDPGAPKPVDGSSAPAPAELRRGLGREDGREGRAFHQQ